MQLMCGVLHASDLQRSSAAWRASGPVSAAAQPAHPDQRSRLWTEPWWSQWSEGRKVRGVGMSKSQLLTVQKIGFWNSYTHQQFKHSSFLVKFCCNKVQQLHLMFTWGAGKRNTKKVTTLQGNSVSSQTDLPYGQHKWSIRTLCPHWCRPGRRERFPAQLHGPHWTGQLCPSVCLDDWDHTCKLRITWKRKIRKAHRKSVNSCQHGDVMDVWCTENQYKYTIFGQKPNCRLCVHHCEDTRCSLCQWRWLSLLSSCLHLVAEQRLGKNRHTISFISLLWLEQVVFFFCLNKFTFLQPLPEGSLLTAQCVRQLGFPGAELCNRKQCWQFWVGRNCLIIKNVNLTERCHLFTSKGLCDSHTLNAST